MFNRKLLITIALSAVIVIGAIVGFVVIPNALNRFDPPDKAPAHTGTVSGNGGNAVMVGGYLYFANGFVSSGAETLVNKQNEYNKVRGEGSIWRVKMPSGEINYDNSYLEDWVDYKDLAPHDIAAKYGNALNKRVNKSDFELVVPKIAGWEKSAIWIFGDNLIYTSPNNQLDKLGALQRDKIDFFRTDLRGRGHAKIYTTKTAVVEPGDYSVVSIDGNPYLLCKDEAALVCVDMRGKVQTLTTRAGEAIFPYATAYYDGFEIGEGGEVQVDGSSDLKNTYSGMMRYVYYTETAETDDTDQNIALFRCEIGKNEPEKLRRDKSTYRLFEIANGNLVFEVTNDKEITTYAVDNTAAGFTESALNNYKLPNNLLEEEINVFISGERTAADAFFYITQGANGTLNLFERKDGFGAGGIKTISGITDFMNIVEVTPAYILYENTNSQVCRAEIFTGKVVNTPSAVDSPVGESRLNAFRPIDESGKVSGANIFFYLKTLTQQDGAGEATVTVAAVIDNSGTEHILARLEDRFVPKMPEDITQNTAAQ